MKSVANFIMNGTTQSYASGYDSTKTMLGQWVQQYSGADVAQYAGPFPITLARPFDDSGVGAEYPCAIDIGNNTHLVFLADVTASSASKKILVYSFSNANPPTWTYVGTITLTLPSDTHTIRGLAVVRHLYTGTGNATAATSGTAVTGVNTTWKTNGYAEGARIGFGSTLPTNISTWYYIASGGGVANDTSLTLTSSAGTIAAGPFVIEELRVYVTTTCGTATNGGLFVAKGITINDFSGTTISLASSTDNQQAVYWLNDGTGAAGVVANTAACGVAPSPTKSDTSHMIYVVDGGGTTTMQVYKYNGRAVLAGLSSGKTTSAFVCKTGTQTMSANIAQYNSICMVAANHGPGMGVNSLYGLTANGTTISTIYRIPETSIADSNNGFVADRTIEVPTGGSNTYPSGSAATYSAGNVMNQIAYCDTLDRFLVLPSSSASKAYLTRYDPSPSMFDRVGLVDAKQQDQASADAGITPFPSNTTSSFSGCVVNGIAYLARGAATQPLSQMYAWPLGADWDFAAGASKVTQNRLITPSLSLYGCSKLYHLGILYDQCVGSDALGQSPEPFRVFWRAAGITDDSGTWQRVPRDWDFTGIAPTANIQFVFEFRTFGPTCIPARIFGLALTYEKIVPDSHFQPSVALSAGKSFAWRFFTAFGGVVPTLNVYLYNSVGGDLLLSDSTTNIGTNNAKGVFQKSTNGGSTWGSYNSTDSGNTTTYIRYTPTYLADGNPSATFKVRAVLSQQ